MPKKKVETSEEQKTLELVETTPKIDVYNNQEVIDTINTEKPKDMFDFDYKPIDPITAANIVKKSPVKKKKQGAGNKAIAQAINTFANIFFNKLGDPLKEEESIMLTESIEEAIKYNFPNADDKVNPNITLALTLLIIVAPRIPAMIQAYKDNKEKKETKVVAERTLEEIKQIQPEIPKPINVKEVSQDIPRDERQQLLDAYLSKR